MKLITVNYNWDPQDWWLEYGLNAEDVTLYDRSDDGVERFFAAKTYRTKNIGDVDFDKLSYLIEQYDNLPDRFIWCKSNIFKYVDPDFLKEAMAKDGFQPLLKMDHKTYSDQYGVVCRYRGEIYEERADSWFFNNPALSTKFHSWAEWCSYVHLPVKDFIPFAPGGNYILTRDVVHRYSRDFYERMRDTLPYAMHPAEAHACERTYYTLWS